MIDRYKSEVIAAWFSDGQRLSRWRHYETDVIMARFRTGDETITSTIAAEIQSTHAPSIIQVAEYERETGHDVVAFLRAWTENMSPEAASQVHLGLTSSDVVDTVLFEALYMTTGTIGNQLGLLAEHLKYKATTHASSRRVGRTHGQHAEPTTLGWRFQVWEDTANFLIDQAADVRDAVNVVKSPGAVGNMRILGEAVGLELARYRRATLVRSTQVIPRQRMVLWAAWLVQIVTLLEEIALEIRLSSRTEVEEMREGASAGRVGSSAMPHKRNPIGSEQISGLARVARSHFGAIAETAGALHHERDLSNSSVERLVVPDLAELTSYMLSKVTTMLADLVVNTNRMGTNLDGLYDTASMQASLQRLGFPYQVAAKLAGHWYANRAAWVWEEIEPEVNHYLGELTLDQFKHRLDLV